MLTPYPFVVYGACPMKWSFYGVAIEPIFKILINYFKIYSVIH